MQLNLVAKLKWHRRTFHYTTPGKFRQIAWLPTFSLYNSTMTIIHTTESKEQQEKDRPELERLHASACKANPTWAFFGGILTIQGREYQVC